MRDLRWRGFWLLTGAVLVLAVVIASLVPLPSSTLTTSDKLMHFAAYAALAAWFGAIYLRRWHMAVVVALVGLGIAVELMQTLTGYRSLELLDVAADAAGAVLGIAMAATPLGGGLGWIERRLLRVT